MAASDWSERTRMLVTVGVVVGVNILLGVGLYMVRGDYKTLEATHQKRVDEKKRLEEEVKKEDSLVNQLKSLKDEIEATKRKLPDKEDVSALIVKIAEVAQKTGCLANSLTQQPTGAAAGPLGLSVSQEIWKTRWKADFMSFSLLVNKIEEHFERFIAFENLMITPTNSGMVAMGTKDGQEEISVDVVTYCYKGQ